MSGVYRQNKMFITILAFALAFFFAFIVIMYAYHTKNDENVAVLDDAANVSETVVALEDDLNIPEDVNIPDDVLDTADDVMQENLVHIEALALAIQSSHNDVQVEALLKEYHESKIVEVINVYYGTESGGVYTYPLMALPADYIPKDRPWYKSAIESTLFISEPYDDDVLNKKIQTITHIVTKGDEIIGVVGIDYNIK